ncbi:hypothetical protein [Microbulbifer sp. SAOS-129_SWC]|uniref:hypothetical protein n=1 Tax=Microbulbifer sp. SAOS-129_SWC TaxID=3145235 RepID=UPI0032168DA3
MTVLTQPGADAQQRITARNSGVQKRTNLVKNPGFDDSLDFWSATTNQDAFSWIGADGNARIGAVAVQSTPPIAPKKRYIYRAEISQCIPLQRGTHYRFAASFKPKGRYKSRSTNRVDLVWYLSDDCNSNGEFGDYLEPKPGIHGWHRIIHEQRARSLNAKSAKITIAQSRTAANHQQALWDDIELTPTEFAPRGDNRKLINPDFTLRPGKNYIHNGDFRSGLANWRYSGDTKWVSTEGGDAPGAARLAIQSDHGGYGAHSFTQCVNFGANQIFNAGANVKVDPGSTQEGGGIFRISWYENGDCSGRHQPGFKSDRVEYIDGWQQLHIDAIEAPDNARSASIGITRGVDDTGRFAYYIDDIYFEALYR